MLRTGSIQGGWVYTSTIHTVVDVTQYYESSLHHVVHTGFTGDVNVPRYRLEKSVLGNCLALISSGRGALLVDVCKYYSFGSSFGKGEGCILANAAGSLKEPSQRGLVVGSMKSLTPVTSAIPPNETLADMLTMDLRIINVYDFGRGYCSFDGTGNDRPTWVIGLLLVRQERHFE